MPHESREDGLWIAGTVEVPELPSRRGPCRFRLEAGNGDRDLDRLRLLKIVFLLKSIFLEITLKSKHTKSRHSNKCKASLVMAG